MQIAPVRYPSVHPHFDHLIVRRVTSVAAVAPSILVTPAFTVQETTAARTMTTVMDARDAEDLVHALSTVIRTVKSRRHEDQSVGFPTYDIEIGWRGHVYRVTDATPGIDDALHALERYSNMTLRRQPVMGGGVA